MMRARVPFRFGLLCLAAAAIPVACGKSIPPPTCPVPTFGHPTLLDLGSAKVQPSVEMAPTLESLKRDYHGKLTVASIDVEQQAEIEKRFDVKRVPTQILFDASGRELFRHEGPWTREEILAKWNELGVTLGAPAAGHEPSAP